MPELDALERRSPEVREADLMAGLVRQLMHAKEKSAFYQAQLAHVAPSDVRDRGDLARLPLTRKADLLAKQQEAPPFGGTGTS